MAHPEGMEMQDQSTSCATVATVNFMASGDLRRHHAAGFAPSDADGANSLGNSSSLVFALYGTLSEVVVDLAVQASNGSESGRSQRISVLVNGRTAGVYWTRSQEWVTLSARLPGEVDTSAEGLTITFDYSLTVAPPASFSHPGDPPVFKFQKVSVSARIRNASHQLQNRPIDQAREIVVSETQSCQPGLGDLLPISGILAEPNAPLKSPNATGIVANHYHLQPNTLVGRFNSESIPLAPGMEAFISAINQDFPLPDMGLNSDSRIAMQTSISFEPFRVVIAGVKPCSEMEHHLGRISSH